jgi:hypothetical protein
MSDPSATEPPAAPPADAASPAEPLAKTENEPVSTAAPAPDAEGGVSLERSPAERTSHSIAPSIEELARRHRDRVAGTVIVVAGFVASLGISLWAKHASRPEVSEPPGPPTTEGLVNFPAHVDPVTTLPVARKLTRRPLLRAILAEGVKSDGTVDLSEGPGRVRYTFQSPQGHGAQPLREPGTLPRQLYCGKQAVLLRKEGLVLDRDKPDSACVSRHLEPLPDPQCSLKRVWAEALQEGAPGDRLARIEYFRSRSGPAYRFEIAGTSHRFTLHGDCERRLNGADAANIAP